MVRRKAARKLSRLHVHVAWCACATCRWLTLFSGVTCVQVEVCCFDKTGTLTSDDMLLEGIAGLDGKGVELMRDVRGSSPPEARPNTNPSPCLVCTSFSLDMTFARFIQHATRKTGQARLQHASYGLLLPHLQVQRVLAGCHSLVYVDGELVGDPLELAGFNAIGTAPH
jgi:magnesium-transporting ATPase (P-type)